MYMNDLGQITPEEYPPKGELLPGAVQPISRRMVPLEPSERRSQREQARRFTPEPIPSENVLLRDKQRSVLETPREEEGTSSSETELQNPSLRKRSDAELDWELAEEGGNRSSVEAEQRRILEGLGEDPDDDEKEPPPEDEVPPPPVAQAPSQGVPAQIPIQPGWRLMHNKVWGRVICREEAAAGRSQVEYVIVDPNGRKIEKVRFNSVNCRIELRRGYTAEEVGKAIVRIPKPAMEAETEVERPEPDDEESPAAAPKGSHAMPRFRPQPDEKKVPLPPSLVDNIELGESEEMDPQKLESALEQGLGMDLSDDEKEDDDKGEQPPGVNGCGCQVEKPTPADAARLMELGLGDEIDSETREQIEDAFFGDE